ncbi:P-loop NTPase [Aquabacterium fontiphilum]|uniref:MinD/ParA family protein n=1 Tax=Aquabacterium fontiphilum TaxID=450365 RepID=UPI001376BE6D|nr:P-loop NTPase [Aquabacterium fontiphilum]
MVSMPATESPPVPTTRIARTVAVTSGKGGVGKTFFSANLAAALSRQGLKVLVLDADLGLANLDVVLNLYPKITLHDVFTGKAELEEAILPAPGGFSVLLAGSGLVEYSRLTPEVREQLHGIFESVKPRFDVVIIDTGAGISDVVLYAVSMAHEVVVVATPEPTSMTDAYATIKVLAAQQGREQLNLVVNQVGRAGDGRGICNQLQQVVERFVQGPTGAAPKLAYLGDIPQDVSVREAVQKRQLLLELHPGSPAAQGVVQVATRLLARSPVSN